MVHSSGHSRLLGAAVVVVWGLLGCGGDHDDPPSPVDDLAGGGTANGGGTAAATGGGGAGATGGGGGTVGPLPDGCPATCPVDQVCGLETHQCVPVQGSIYYFDPDAPDGGLGGYASPWNSYQQVQQHAFEPGDDLYFKAGSTYEIPTDPDDSSTWYRRFEVWDGTPTNPTVIGAYWDEGRFGLGGSSRPVLDFQEYGGRRHSGAVNYSVEGGVGHVHIMDLEVRNTNGTGIKIAGRNAADGSVHDCWIYNCRTKNTDSMGIGLYFSKHGLVENCSVEDSNQEQDTGYQPYPHEPPHEGDFHGGNGIDINGMQQRGRTQHNTVRGCEVIRAYEGIGTYKGAEHSIVEHSIVRDCRTYYLYATNSSFTTFRYNIAYATKDGRDGKANAGGGVMIDNEGHNPAIHIHDINGHRAYGNMVAGMGTGIGLLNNGGIHGVFPKDIEVVGNIVVDCAKNFVFNATDPSWSNISYRDNVSFIFDEDEEGLVHTTRFSPPGVTWDHNFWNTPVEGNAAQDENTDDLQLAKTSGWRTLPPGGVDESFFELQ